MRKILVTGATGFVGQHVIKAALAAGLKVIASSGTATKAESCSWYPDVRYIPFRLEDAEHATGLFDHFEKPDLLLHLAWEGLPNYNDPFHIKDNLPRHRKFLGTLLNEGLRSLVVSGTCFEYGLREGMLSESFDADPRNAYAIAKNRLREWLEIACKESKCDFKWVRLFYMFGKGQNPNSLLSQLAAAISRGETSFNMSPGDQLRDYLPIERVAGILVQIASHSGIQGIINCCSGVPISVIELVQSYLASIDHTMQLNTGFYPYSELEPRNFWGDPEKLNKILTHV